MGQKLCGSRGLSDNAGQQDAILSGGVDCKPNPPDIVHAYYAVNKGIRAGEANGNDARCGPCFFYGTKTMW